MSKGTGKPRSMCLLARLEAACGFRSRALTRWERLLCGQPEEPLFYREALNLLRRLDPARWETTAAAPAVCHCQFIGCGRSGHSLVGSMIDAHPNAVIAHEFHVFGQMDHFDPPDLRRCLRLNSAAFAANGREWTGYNYNTGFGFPGDAEGTLMVIGDKKGGGTAQLLAREPQRLPAFLERSGVPLRFVHVIRNPFDNLSTYVLRSGESLEEASAWYRLRLGAVTALKRMHPELPVLDLYLDDLQRDPAACMEQVFSFLGLPAVDAVFLAACRSFVKPEPSRTRDRVQWTDAHISDLDALCSRHPFLQRYAGTYHSEAAHD